MKRTNLIFTLLLAALLAGCNLPAAVTLTPASPDQPSVTLAVPSASETALPAQAASPSPAVTPPASTEPATQPPAVQSGGTPVSLYQIRMLNAQQGWGWASQTGDLDKLLRTADGGQTWQNASPPGKYVYYNSFFLDDQAAWLSFYDQAANTGGLLRTLDGGKTWTSLPPNEMLQNASVEFTSPQDGVAETAGVGAGNAYLNYYQTNDGGTTWTPIPVNPPTPEPGLPAGTVHLCNICGDRLYRDPARMIIIRGDLASDPTGKVNLSVTTNLGQTWKPLELPFPDAKYAGGMVAPLLPSFFGSQGLLPVNIIKYNQDGSLAFSVLAMYTSQDGGQTWTALPSVLDNGASMIDTVQFISATDAFVRCASHLCSTRDGGQTWQVLPDSLNFDHSASSADYVLQVSFIDPSTGWAISGESGATTLWKSTDGGAAWSRMSPSLLP